jgi:PAS domain S-box-containing protein
LYVSLEKIRVETYEEVIKQALNILEGRHLERDSVLNLGARDDVEPAELLLHEISLLVDNRRDTANRLSRVQKELAVFKEANTETNRMLEKKIEEISLLRLITDTTSRAILSRDPFKIILDKVIGIVGADNGCIALIDTETGTLEVNIASGNESFYSDNPLFDPPKNIAEFVANSGEPYLVGDTAADPYFASFHDDLHGIRSLLSFPLVVENETVGVLNVSSTYPHAFAADTERIMHIIAGQISIAIQNVRLYREIRKTKEYLENLVERAGDAIFTLARDHKIVSWNTGADLIFRRKKEDVLENAICDLFPEDVAPLLLERIESVLTSGQILTVEIDALRGDGKITQIALTLSPIREATGEVVGVSGIAKDITEQKRVEEELIRLNEAKTNFVSTVSHELRTPLTSIKSFTEVLLHEMTSLSKESVKRYLTLMNEECDRLSGLISCLLDLQKLSAGKLEAKLEPLLLADLARQAAELFDRVAFQNHIQFSSEFLVPDEKTRVLGDRDRLMQILSNLLSNALKYTDTDGQVQIRLDREHDAVKLTVVDSGIGIPDGEKDKVFEKFYQVNNSVTRVKGGAGLGLAITKELVTLHGGKIWVEGREEGGCSFNILIPAAK